MVWSWLLACTEEEPIPPDTGSDSSAPAVDSAPVTTDPFPATTTDGGAEQCVLLFGGNDRIRGVDDDLPLGSGARTVQAWIRTHTRREQIAVSYGRPSPGQGFLLGTVDGHPLLRLGSGLERVVIEDVDVADDEWHLLAVSWDGDLAVFAVDGEVVGTGRIPGETLEGDLVAGNTPTGDLSTPWYGWLDDVKVIGGVRLPADIAADPDAARVDPAALLLWWDFEGIDGYGLGLGVPDLSGNGRDGVVAGTQETPTFPPCR